MKLSHKVSLAVLSASAFLGLVGPMAAHAATTPNLLTAGTYGVLSTTFTANGTVTTVTGDVGYTTLDGSGSISVSGDTDQPAPGQSGTDAGLALSNLNSQDCTSLGTAVALNAITISGYPTGTFPPGCYSSSGAMTITLGTTVTLNGVGTYIFRPNAAITTGANSIVKLTNGASSCDVFWTPNGDTTLGANSTFVGIDIPVAQDIYVGNLVSWVGRALAFGHVVTTATASINSTCATGIAVSNNNQQTGLITVVKTVINDNGGTKTVADFPLFVNGTPVVSGVTNTFPAPATTYTVTETSNTNYIQTFSGACDSTGRLTLSPGDQKVCVITNDDIGAVAVVPPLIDVVKIPSPLALPNGPGPVKYTYTLKNIGTVPVTNVTMVGDTCSPITLISGDTNNNQKLEVSETWVYTCSTTLSKTHTNIVTTTGWANGVSAVDIASATVVVGASAVPPLIHVTKVPNPLSLSAGGGTVVYTEKVTNPGTVALSDVTLIDDKCSPMKYISGDTNNDQKLDMSETWVYTCQANLSRSTTNTATAVGGANGMTARDFAVATVLVAAPGLPNTGLPADVGGVSLNTIMLALILIIVVTSLAMTLRKREI